MRALEDIDPNTMLRLLDGVGDLLEWIYGSRAGARARTRQCIHARTLVVGWLLKPAIFGNCSVEALAVRHRLKAKALHDQIKSFRVTFTAHPPPPSKESLGKNPCAGKRAIPD